MIRIAFFGTPEVAVPALEAFATESDIEIAAVVTNPDRPRGRSRRPVPPPVKESAVAHGLRVLQPERPVEIVDELAVMDLDACAIVAYGALLPRKVLDTGGAGFVNLHFSLLPRWRGAAPVQHAILSGDVVTGVTTFVLDEGMDTGPILRQVEVPIGPSETSASLLERLAAVGAPVLVDSIRALVAGATPREQDDDGATLAPKITPEDVEIDWNRSSGAVADLVRAANPSPGAHTSFRGERLKIWHVEPVDGAMDADAGADEGREPGTVLASGKDGVVVACGEGAVTLSSVQPAGKARMSGTAFANGYQPEVGSRIGA